MDVSGNNRYELLDMDDEAGPAVVPLGGAKKKPEESNTTKKNTNKTEKENKSNTLNKNNAPSKGPNAAQTNKPKAGVNAAAAAAPGRPKNNAKGDQTTGAPHKEHQQRAVRNNTRANAEAGNSGAGGNDYGNNEPPHRQFKEREYRGPPRIRNGEKFGKREFDRQSGSDKTGIKAIDKRDGAGAHNWGSAKQDIDDINKTGDAPQLTDKEDSANEQTGDQANNLEEDESKQMTLDEWKALRDQRAKPNYNLRKAGEGVDNSEWKKMVVLSKKRDNNSEDDLEYDPSMYPQRVGRLQRIVDIQFNFNDNRRGGFRKGGPRGPPRSGGGGGGFRQENAGAPAASNGFERAPANKFGGEKRRPGAKPLKVDDELQFPTLS